MYQMISNALASTLLFYFFPFELKALANENTLLQIHCCRHKCFPVCPCAQLLLRTQKMFLILFRNILSRQQMFPSLRSSRNIMGNNVSSFTRALRNKEQGIRANGLGGIARHKRNAPDAPLDGHISITTILFGPGVHTFTLIYIYVLWVLLRGNPSLQGRK